MFSRTTASLAAIAVLFAGQVLAAPLAEPKQVRTLAAFKPIAAYELADFSAHDVYGRRDDNPEDQAATSPGGVVKSYGRRDDNPEDQASTSPNGVIKPYGRRDNNPEDQASTSPDGVVKPYGRQENTEWRRQENTEWRRQAPSVSENQAATSPESFVNA